MVSVLFRAADVPGSAREDYWREVVSDVLGRHEMRLPDGIDGRDRLQVGALGSALVGSLSAGRPAEVYRTAQAIRRSDRGLCKVFVLERGRGIVRQDGRDAELRAGDLALIDLSAPVSWTMSAMRCVAVAFPRPLLPIGGDKLRSATAVRIAGDRGVGALLSSLARQLPDRIDQCSPVEQARLATTVLDLTATALDEHLDAATTDDVRRRALLAQIHGFIDTHLTDPDLSPVAIAAAHHISIRLLHKLFETQGETVAGRIRHRRLEQCRRDLANPALESRPVSAIGARWGFTNAAHFSRLFRATYGLPPHDYRSLAAGR